MLKRAPLILLLMCGAARAVAYKCVDAAGVVSFQQMPCAAVESHIAPLQTHDIGTDQIRQTLVRYVEALRLHDQRARLRFFSDDVMFNLYDDPRFDYIRERYRKMDVSQMHDRLLPMEQALVDADSLEVERENAVQGQFQVLLYSPSRNPVPARMHFGIVNGELVITRWDAVR